MHIQPINLKFYGAWGLALLFSGGYATALVGDSISRHNALRAQEQVHQAQLNAIERSSAETRAQIEAKAAKDQAYIDNNVAQFSSIRITNYTCTPTEPPQGVDWSAYADEGRQDVTDRNGRVIGYTERGAFAFIPENCN